MLARLVCLSDKCVSLVSVLAWLVCFCVFNPDKCVTLVYVIVWLVSFSKLALFFSLKIILLQFSPLTNFRLANRLTSQRDVLKLS